MGALRRGAPAVALGIVIACLISFVFVPSVIALYQMRGSPPVSVDSRWLSLVALVANVVVLGLIIWAGRRSGAERER